MQDIIQTISGHSGEFDWTQCKNLPSESEKLQDSLALHDQRKL